MQDSSQTYSPSIPGLVSVQSPRFLKATISFFSLAPIQQK